MGTTKLKIYNLALWNLGIKSTLDSTIGTDVCTVALNMCYEDALKEILKRNDWPFARCYKELTLTQSSKSQNPNYKYEFDYPGDCIAAREIISLDPNTMIDFEPACNTDTMERVINSNVDSGTLKYTKYIDKESFFPSEFIMVLSWYLSLLICDGCGVPNKKEIAYKMYQNALDDAEKSGAMEGYENRESSPSYLEVRN